MNGAIDEPELLTEVPAVLKKLAKVVVRGFYECEHATLINILTNSIYPCVKEEDLQELLKFDKKQLRQVLMRLKSDKLIKQRIHKEKQPENGTTLTFNYYFINYKLFVNVVKYKLDHIRKKIESDEKQAKNRPSFLCSACHNRYSDLEVDRLLDMETGALKCTTCEGTVEEDVTDIKQANNSRTSLAKFNEQMEPIFRLLRDCENLNLAPTILEPEPSPLQIAASLRQNPSSGGSVRHGWASGRTGGFDVLNEPGIEIRIGSEDQQDGEKGKKKDTPVWMLESTVLSTPTKAKILENEKQAATVENEAVSAHKDEGEILQDLLAHESVEKKPRLDVKAAFGEEVDDDESDTSEDSDSEFLTTPQPKPQDTKVTETVEMMIDSDQDDDDEEVPKVKVGNKMVALGDVTDEMMKAMTPEEHDAYTKACQQAYSHYY